MHKRCTASACRAELPRHALRCPKCGRATGRVAPPPRARRQPKPARVPHPLDAGRDALILEAREHLRALPDQQVRLGDDYFDALRQRSRVRCVKAIKTANGCGLKEAMRISDALRQGF